MTRTPTYEDDYSDDFAYGCDKAGYYVLEEEYEEPYYGFSSFTEVVEANSIYAGVAERAYHAACVADDRKYNHAYRASDNARRNAAYKAERAADPEAVRAKERERQRACRARKRAQRAQAA